MYCHFDLLLVHRKANYWNKVWWLLHPNNHVIKYCMDDECLDEKSLYK